MAGTIRIAVNPDKWNVNQPITVYCKPTVEIPPDIVPIDEARRVERAIQQLDTGVVIFEDFYTVDPDFYTVDPGEPRAVSPG